MKTNTHNTIFLFLLACVAIVSVGCVAPQQQPTPDPVEELSVNPSDVTGDDLRRLMAQIEALASESKGDWSCAFNFKIYKNSVSLNLTTYNDQLQTIRMPGDFRLWTEEGVGGLDLHIQGAKYFTCGSYSGKTARELVVKLNQLNTLLSHKMAIRTNR